MKIICTVSEFAKMIRSCEKAYCYQCVLGDICDGDEHSLEKFISAADITDDQEDEET